jgi:hypothetical protein
MPCDLRVAGQAKTAGFVADASASGLFVQTSAQAEPGTAVQVWLRQADGTPMELITTAVRWRRSHRGAASVITGGLALRVEKAPEAYYQTLLRLFAEE